MSLQNEGLTLSLACDSYSIAQAAALVPYETAAQRDAAIAAALTAYSATTETNAAIAAALVQFYTAAQVDTQIANAVAGIDLSPYYTSAQTDAAITAALAPVTLSNALAWGANPPTWEVLKGTNVLRNLHFAGPLSASLQNNTDTLEIDCDSYEKTETYTQAEALNITQYRTNSQVSQAISDALAPYYTSTEVDSAMASNSVDLSDYYTRSQSDSRYFLQNASPGHTPNRKPTVATSLRPLFPTKRQQRQRRHFPLMVITTLTPRMIRAILPRPPLSGALILGNAGTLELNCDCYNKSESDGRYYTRGQADAAFAPLQHRDRSPEPEPAGHRHRLKADNIRRDPLPADISVNSVSATGDWLTLVGGSSGTRIQDHANNTLFSMTTAEAFFGVRSRVNWRLTIDTPSGSDEGLYTAAVRARVGDALLTLTGGAAGLGATRLWHWWLPL